MAPDTFSNLFVAALLATLFIKVALMVRQRHHVRGRREQVPAPFADSIGLESHRKAADYTCARMALGVVDATVGAAFVLALTLGGGLQAMHRVLAGWFDPDGLAHGIALLAALGVLGWLIELPFVLYRTFVIEKRFGFNRMTPALYVADVAREALLAALIGLPVLAAVLWLMGAMGEHWWLWVWLFWFAFNLLGLFVWPTFIAPLFNKFTPLADEALRKRVENLLARCGFRSRGLFVMDGSRRSAHGNAYFTGFGAAKRIVFFDTLLDKLSPAEVEAVLAHELGHFHHRHIWKRLAVVAATSLALLWLLAWLMGQSWFFAGLGIDDGAGGTAVALALFALVLPVFAFPLGPLMSHWSRVHEFQADAYAARQASATDLAAALVKLYRDNASTLTPDPLYSRFFDSHPPASLRVSRLRAGT
ncbi:M48 family metallopeptidase [Aromatoleum aromaticum]|uniref:Peptidase family M48 protein n=1 Tax=Aromatoleum aromaticum (strain DSM 19018 / LMG 30748 / EbN1) TaxID=76114 RepID=Q5P0T6_AROAE|nr:M48 family metallopeptidase [Aromatoleum aromaticum]NMG55971.1 M48 family metalloprotease [Aromatoleum aromaticum]CAI09078.1 putative peptidase family M48 protein [Aromatoleum aromaticum EbN1]